MSTWGQARCLDKDQLLRDASGKLPRTAANQIKRRAWCNRTISAVVSGIAAGPGASPCSVLNGQWVCAWIEPSQLCFFGSDFGGGSGPVGTGDWTMRIYTAAAPDGWLLRIYYKATNAAFRSWVGIAGAPTSQNYPDAYCPIGAWTITGQNFPIGGYECLLVEGSVTTEWVA